MADHPYMPLWTDAYLADTTHLNAEEHGVYLLLLMCAWRAPNCDIPDDDKQLALMARVTPTKWRRLKPTIMAFWRKSSAGTWEQKRLTATRKHSDIVRERRRESGAKGGRPRKQTVSEPKPNGLANVEQTESIQGPRSEDRTDLGGPRSGVASSAKTRGTFIPTNWKPSDDDWNYAARKGLSPQEIADEAEKFVLYWKAAAGQRARKRDWAATWKTWVRNARSHAPRGAREPPSRTKLRELAQEDRARDGRSVLGDFLGQD